MPTPNPAVWTKLIDAAALRAGVRELGLRIRADYADEPLLLVGLLEGGLFFLADLARAIPGAVETTTMRVASYHQAIESSGEVQFLSDLQAEIAGRNVIVVDDIYDSGRTLTAVRARLQSRRPKSLEFACLLGKQKEPVAPVAVKYMPFSIPDAFVVGAGLDLAGMGRNLPDIWALRPGASETAARDQIAALWSGDGGPPLG